MGSNTAPREGVMALGRIRRGKGGEEADRLRLRTELEQSHQCVEMPSVEEAERCRFGIRAQTAPVTAPPQLPLIAGEI